MQENEPRGFSSRASTAITGAADFEAVTVTFDEIRFLPDDRVAHGNGDGVVSLPATRTAGLAIERCFPAHTGRVLGRRACAVAVRRRAVTATRHRRPAAAHVEPRAARTGFSLRSKLEPQRMERRRMRRSSRFVDGIVGVASAAQNAAGAVGQRLFDRLTPRRGVETSNCRGGQRSGWIGHVCRDRISVGTDSSRDTVWSVPSAPAGRGGWLSRPPRASTRARAWHARECCRVPNRHVPVRSLLP